MIRLQWVAMLLCAARAWAWGPHAEITQAALDALGTNDALIRYLGPHAQRLTNYAWMADYRRLPFEEPNELFYADDYLLFPDAMTHWDHICPEVKKTYRPYFRRALQALRTETPRNAARWIGSLLHFVEDTGSPPHAAEIRGTLHTRLETWVDAKQIQIRGYTPRLMGTNDDQALEGFLKRMDEIIVFSKERAKRARLNAEIGNRKAVEPVVLESALETSRLTADLLHTLGAIAAGRMATNGTLRGVAQSDSPMGLERFAAKLLIEGTSYSTLADADGWFEFRDLPQGDYKLIALRPGGQAVTANVHVQEGQTNGCRLTLKEESRNLIRNGDFAIRWKDRNSPDCWDFWQGTWNGEIVPLKVNQKYRLAAKFKPDVSAEVVVRWTRQLPHALPRMAAAPMFQTRKLNPEENTHEFVGSENFGLLQLSIACSGKRPQDVLESIQLLPLAQ